MAKKKTEEVKAEKVGFAKPTEKDFVTLLDPVITEKSMTLMQDQNKVVLKVSKDANKTAVKLAFERVYKVKVVNVQIINVNPKSKTRGTRYKGTVSGYKKAIVTLAEGEAVDLYKD